MIPTPGMHTMSNNNNNSNNIYWLTLKEITKDRFVHHGLIKNNNRPFAKNDHMVQNPPYWRASSLLFPHWDIKTKRPQPVKCGWPFVLMSQCWNNNELALQYGGFCTM